MLDAPLSRGGLSGMIAAAAERRVQHRH